MNGTPFSSSRSQSTVTPGYQFASDNTSGLCPEVIAAIMEANAGAAASYGDDAWTDQASAQIREFFGTDAEVFFCFNGTAANSLAISHLCRSYHSVLCHSLAHIETDECGGPEFFSHGAKILLAGGEHGRLEPQSIEEIITRRSDIHFPRPRVISLTQQTELGTAYRPEQIAALGELARRHHMLVHMDGARFFNAVAWTGASPAELTWKAGVNVVCLGGTKAGMLASEAVVFFDRELAREFDYRCKQAGQLASKMRFMAAPWVGLLRQDAWLKHARHANGSARTLASGLESIPGIALYHPVEGNAVFVTMPDALVRALRQRGWSFYNFIGAGVVRFMCSWATTQAEIDALVRDATIAGRSTVTP